MVGLRSAAKLRPARTAADAGGDEARWSMSLNDAFLASVADALQSRSKRTWKLDSVEAALKAALSDGPLPGAAELRSAAAKLLALLPGPPERERGSKRKASRGASAVEPAAKASAVAVPTPDAVASAALDAGYLALLPPAGDAPAAPIPPAILSRLPPPSDGITGAFGTALEAPIPESASAEALARALAHAERALPAAAALGSAEAWTRLSQRLFEGSLAVASLAIGDPDAAQLAARLRGCARRALASVSCGLAAEGAAARREEAKTGRQSWLRAQTLLLGASPPVPPPTLTTSLALLLAALATSELRASGELASAAQLCRILLALTQPVGPSAALSLLARIEPSSLGPALLALLGASLDALRGPLAPVDLCTLWLAARRGAVAWEDRVFEMEAAAAREPSATRARAALAQLRRQMERARACGASGASGAQALAPFFPPAIVPELHAWLLARPPTPATARLLAAAPRGPPALQLAWAALADADLEALWASAQSASGAEAGAAPAEEDFLFFRSTEGDAQAYDLASESEDEGGIDFQDAMGGDSAEEKGEE